MFPYSWVSLILCSFVIAGIHSKIDTVFVLSGVTAKEDLKRFAHRPRYILHSAGEIPKCEK
jgi:ribonucleotide monophosphatase NagD (HAD superfamily)